MKNKHSTDSDYFMTYLRKKPWFKYQEQQWRQQTATVVGAGIAGCQLAYQLQKQGWKVQLLDQNNKIASHASGNPAGIVAPKFTAAPSAAEDFYQQAFNYIEHQLSQFANHHDYWNPCGLIQIATLPRDIKRFKKIAQRNFPKDTLQHLSSEKASKISQTQITQNSLYYPRAGWLRPNLFCKELTKDIEIIYNRSISALQRDNQQWCLYDSQQKCISSSDIVVFCTGEQAPINTLYQPPIIPIAGQTSYVESSVLKLKTIIDHQGYIIPNIQAQKSLIGASYHRNQCRQKCTEQDNQDNLTLQLKHLTNLPSLKVSSAHCAIRATTPDRLPYIGGIPEETQYQQDYSDIHQGKQWKKYPLAHYEKGLYIMTGFGSRGLTTSAFCAHLLVKLITNQCDGNDYDLLSKCHPARFIISALQKSSF